MLQTPAQTGKEGSIAKVVEQRISQIPSDIFLWIALDSIGSALRYNMVKKDHNTLYTGQWLAPFLLMGIYNKLVKQQDHNEDY